MRLITTDLKLGRDWSLTDVFELGFIRKMLDTSLAQIW